MAEHGPCMFHVQSPAPHAHLTVPSQLTKSRIVILGRSLLGMVVRLAVLAVSRTRQVSCKISSEPRKEWLVLQSPPALLPLRLLFPLSHEKTWTRQLAWAQPDGQGGKLIPEPRPKPKVLLSVNSFLSCLANSLPSASSLLLTCSLTCTDQLYQQLEQNRRLTNQLKLALNED